ncbi:MAG: hypothetical protein IPO87_19130 [Flavobacteriales bacterium]|nr:hypothetical protein [Flavobacteriales bacterium]
MIQLHFHSEPARQHAHDLAVKLNKAMVQKQLDVFQDLDKSSSKLESAQKDVMKNDKNLSKANKALTKATAADQQVPSKQRGLQRKDLPVWNGNSRPPTIQRT